MLLLRLERIFCFNFAFRKTRNTPSIPDFPEFNLKQRLSPKSSKQSFRDCLKFVPNDWIQDEHIIVMQQ